MKGGGRPAPDSILLMKMKRKRLHLKDEIHRILRSYTRGGY
ncbi:TPA: YdcH family protein [Salmonella enterica subsp. enterica serovar Typhimurium]|nr:YdcH family protein [Salmonella enterica subsp. enterica serovar Typhimurium]HED0201586.1 YdcH family protein [Salmonella enterica subsp. enterica serovar Orientalis]